jgi:hypothetical protein
LRWNYGSSQFEPIRLLATAFPTASVLFTSQSLLLVCDEIFEVDLKDFSVDGMDSINIFKGVIQSKKTFDMCYQTLREPHCHQQN